MRFHPFALAAILLVPIAMRSHADEPTAKQRSTNIYDESANASQQIADAVARAKKDNKRVLVQWGANWCGWCHKLHDLCAKDPDIQKEFLYEYEVVLVDVGHMKATDTNMALAAKLGASFENAGIPYLTVLDSDGKPIHQQATGPLEVGDHHDPAKVVAFLKEHKAPPLDAETVLATAIAKAKAEKRVVFAHFGAPWCGWCRKLDGWLATEAVAKDFESRAIEVKIDIERMTHGDAVMTRYRGAKNDGIPWFVFLDAEGKALVTSDLPKGNLGYPGSSEEIDAFSAMLSQVGFDDAARARLVESLRAASPQKAVK